MRAPPPDPAEPPVPAALRRHFARHNRHVFFLAAGTLIMALAFWGAVYVLLYWMTVMAVTIVQGAEATMPAGFLGPFAVSAAVVCLLVWMARRVGDEKPRDDLPAFRIVADLLLVVPRTTLAVCDTLRAFRFLSESDLALAWQFLRSLNRSDTVAMHSLPLVLPDPRRREKILMALQLAGLVEFREKESGFVVALRDEHARLLTSPKVRIQARS